MTVLYAKNLPHEADCINCASYSLEYTDDIKAIDQEVGSFNFGHSPLNVVDWMIEVGRMSIVDLTVEPKVYLICPKRAGQKLAQCFYLHQSGTWSLGHYTTFDLKIIRRNLGLWHKSDVVSFDKYRVLRAKGLLKGRNRDQKNKTIPGGWVDGQSGRYKWKYPSG